jgi:hypothetical protein
LREREVVRHRLRLRTQELPDHLWAAEQAGVRVLPNLQIESARQSSARPYRYIVVADKMDNQGPSPTWAQAEFEFSNPRVIPKRPPRRRRHQPARLLGKPRLTG